MSIRRQRYVPGQQRVATQVRNSHADILHVGVHQLKLNTVTLVNALFRCKFFGKIETWGATISSAMREKEDVVIVREDFSKCRR